RRAKVVDVFPGIGSYSSALGKLIEPKDFFNEVFAGLRGDLKIMEFSLNFWSFRNSRTSFGFWHWNRNVARYRAFFPVYSFHEPKYRFVGTDRNKRLVFNLLVIRVCCYHNRVYELP